MSIENKASPLKAHFALFVLIRVSTFSSIAGCCVSLSESRTTAVYVDSDSAHYI